MTRPLAALTLLLAASAASAQILGTLELVATDIETFDPTIFAAGPNVDVWHVSLENPFAADVTSLELSLPGPWQNFSSGGLAFNDSTELPMLGPNTVAESFFVLPSGTTPLAVDTIDDGTLLSSSYTVAGDTALVPAGGSAVVAVLTTLAGELTDPAAVQLCFTGTAAVGGVFQDAFVNLGTVSCRRCPPDNPDCPEPTSALLAGVAAMAAGCRAPRWRRSGIGNPFSSDWDNGV